jgi:hypothetical protein
MLELPNRNDWFIIDHEIPHPSWGRIGGWIRAMCSLQTQEEAYRQAVRSWLSRLAKSIQGNLAIQESANFHFLSPLNESEAHRTLEFLEHARDTIVRAMGEQVDPPWQVGKHVVVRFANHDDYYRYASHFYPDGRHPSSSGMFISEGGYGHIILPPPLGYDRSQFILVHELTHNLLCNLPLPAWLNEGLAMTFENTLLGVPLPLLNAELVERHRERWTSGSIQEFWMGWSFYDPVDHDLAYSLAAILMRAIQTDLRPPPEDFRRFVLRADHEDAGAIATREHLGLELSDLAATFLGPGDWSPQPDGWKTLWKEASERNAEPAEPEPEFWEEKE